MRPTFRLGRSTYRKAVHIMTLLVTFLLLAGGLTLNRFGKIRSGQTLMVVSAMLALGGASGLIAQPLLHSLQWPYVGQLPQHWANNNLIILLGGGSEPVDDGTVESEVFAKGRIQKTATLYAECKATSQRCSVLVSGGDPQRHGITEAAVYQQELIRLGVNPVDIRPEDQSNNTWQNAAFSTVLVKQHYAEPGTNIMLVTSAYHMRRSLMFFTHFGLHPVPVRADYLGRKPMLALNAYNFLLTDVALHEYFGVWRYELYEEMGWNAVQPETLTPLHPPVTL
jgi:uncharacterized SAM-binding protein YcdF (DUF218 family)